MNDIANLVFLLSSRSTLLIRNKLEMQVFSPSAVKICVDGGDWSFPVGQLSLSPKHNADKNDHCFDETIRAQYQNLGKEFEVLLI